MKNIQMLDRKVSQKQQHQPQIDDKTGNKKARLFDLIGSPSNNQEQQKKQDIKRPNFKASDDSQSDSDQSSGDEQSKRSSKLDSLHSSMRSSFIEDLNKNSRSISSIVVRKPSVKAVGNPLVKTQQSLSLPPKKINPGHMNILMKDQGFNNLRGEYPALDTEVIADYYIKSDFNVTRTIRAVYEGIKIMPQDKKKASILIQDNNSDSSSDEEVSDNSEEQKGHSIQSSSYVGSMKGRQMYSNNNQIIQEKKIPSPKHENQNNKLVNDNNKQTMSNQNSNNFNRPMNNNVSKPRKSSTSSQKSGKHSRKDSTDQDHSYSDDSSSSSEQSYNYQVRNSVMDQIVKPVSLMQKQNTIQQQKEQSPPAAQSQVEPSLQFAKEQKDKPLELPKRNVFDQINTLKQTPINPQESKLVNVDIHKKQEFLDQVGKSMNQILEEDDPYYKKNTDKRAKLDMLLGGTNIYAPKNNNNNNDVNPQNIQLAIRKDEGDLTTDKSKNVNQGNSFTHDQNSQSSSQKELKQFKRPTILKNQNVNDDKREKPTTSCCWGYKKPQQDKEKKMVHEKVGFFKRFL